MFATRWMNGDAEVEVFIPNPVKESNEKVI